MKTQRIRIRIKISKPLYILGLLLIILNLGCIKNACENTKKVEPYFLSDTTKAFITNYIGTKRIIFTNESNEEIVFQVSEIVDSMVLYLGEIICNEGSNTKQLVKGESQFIELSLSSPDFDKSFIISLVEHPQIITKRIQAENILISFGTIANSIKQEDVLLVHYPLKDTNYSVVRDSVILNNKIFYNVIESINEQTYPKFEIKYTKAQGIIYIKERTTNKEYIYKRKE